jgi:DNA-binding NtrC family response regulator
LKRVGMLSVVLLVEDDPQLLRAFSRMLRSSRYELVLATRPKQALSEALRARDRLRLLITDQNLNGLGEALADDLSSRIPGLRVLVLSGDPYLKTKYEILVKPFGIEGLRDKVLNKLGLSE